MYLFDTCVFSYALQGHSFALKYASELESKDGVFISAQTVEEVLFVAQKRNWGPTKLQVLETAFKRFGVLSLSMETSRISAELRSEALKIGRVLSTPDAWILSTAKQYDYTLVSHDQDMLAGQELGVRIVVRP